MSKKRIVPRVGVLFPVFFLITLSMVKADSSSFLFAPTGANFYVYGRGTDTFIINQSKISQWQIDRGMAQLASGKRIVDASVDPSGFAVAEKMDALLKQMRQESANDEDMRNYYAFVDAAVGEDQDLLKRIRELVMRSANGIFTAEDRGYNQTEIDELLKQIDMNAQFAQFNTVRVIPQLTVKELGLDSIDVGRSPEAAMGIIDAASKLLMKKRVLQGVKANILTFRIEGKSYNYLNLQRAESGIRDMDMAEGISELIKNSVLVKCQTGLIARPK